MNKVTISTALLITVMSAGCAPGDPATTDTDGDGYFAGVDDCDDRDAAVNPGATERNVDLIDSDCDGALSVAPFVVGDYGPAGGFVFYTDGIQRLSGDSIKAANTDLLTQQPTFFEFLFDIGSELLGLIPACI